MGRPVGLQQPRANPGHQGHRARWQEEQHREDEGGRGHRPEEGEGRDDHGVQLDQGQVPQEDPEELNQSIT